MGSLVVTTYRQRLAPLMTRYETSQYATQAVLRAAILEDFEIKLGKLRGGLPNHRSFPWS
jgi:hypothetical protein